LPNQKLGLQRSTNDVVGVAAGIVVGGGGASATAVVIAAGDAVAADNDNAVDAVVPPSLTKDEDAHIGASVAFEGVCVGAFADGATAADVALSLCRHHRSLRAAATALPPSRCAPPPRFALPPPPLMPPCCRRHPAVALSPPAGLIGGGGITLLSLAQSIVDYPELCMGGGMINRSPYIGIVS
jgi:hypothetical protein